MPADNATLECAERMLPPGSRFCYCPGLARCRLDELVLIQPTRPLTTERDFCAILDHWQPASARGDPVLLPRARALHSRARGAVRNVFTERRLEVRHLCIRPVVAQRHVPARVGIDPSVDHASARHRPGAPVHQRHRLGLLQRCRRSCPVWRAVQRPRRRRRLVHRLELPKQFSHRLESRGTHPPRRDVAARTAAEPVYRPLDDVLCRHGSLRQHLGHGALRNRSRQSPGDVPGGRVPHRRGPLRPGARESRLQQHGARPKLLVARPRAAAAFYIGDGLTGEGSGAVQSFLVPDTATRLFLGFLDGAYFVGGPDYYDNNRGSFAVTAVAVPEPSTCAMALAGLACGGYSMFRRRKQA